MATRDIEEKAREANEAARASDEESTSQKVRRYIAPKIRTLSLPMVARPSGPCNPSDCPPDRYGCGPNICSPIAPPGRP